MTNEELTTKLRRVGERALSSNLQELLDQAADALEAATAIIEYGRKKRLTGQVYGPLKGVPYPSWWGESQEDYLHVQRTVGPWEEIE